MKPEAVSSLWHLPSLSLDAQIPDVIRHTALRSSDFPLPKRERFGSDRPVHLHFHASRYRAVCINVLELLAVYQSFCLYPRHESKGNAELPLKPLTVPTYLQGCPRFAKAFLGRKRWAKPTTALYHLEQTTCGDKLGVLLLRASQTTWL
jgi:hypothetical protein